VSVAAGTGVDGGALSTGVEWAAVGLRVDSGGGIGYSGTRVNPNLTDGSRATVITGSNQTRLGTDPSLAQGHPISKMKFSLSKTG
jgi:hypothetical protein